MTPGRPFLRLLFLLLFGLGPVAAQTPPLPGGDAPAPPAPLREFRGAWVATVANIDWPSKPGLAADRQKAEMTALLDRAARLKLNAVVLQVRPAADALYLSPLEPWSEYLSGRMGQGPDPFYDPLAFAVAEAHKRGLELHAWFNPFRARHAGAKSPPSFSHISRTHPELVKVYGTEWWLDPGEPAAQNYSLAVVLDVVRRYDIDAVHIDDYFYPYPDRDARGRAIEFPDGPSWQRYRRAGGRKNRGDWRRANIDVFVQHLYQGVKRVKPWVKVGISPFGIYRPGQPAQIKGFDAYASLYADSRRWLSRGWLDYCAPQLYWKIEQRAQSFPVLLAWWAAQNRLGRHLWPGLFTSRVGSGAAAWPPGEIVYQIRTTRGVEGVTGHIHYSMVALGENRAGIADALGGGVYAQPALAPASPWLDSTPPAAPLVAVQTVAGPAGARTLIWQPNGAEPAWLWVAQWRVGGVWTTQILPGAQTALPLPPGAAAVAVSAVDRCGNQSVLSVLALGPEGGAGN